MWWRKGDNAAVEEDGDNILIEHDEADDDIEGGLIENREDDEDEEEDEDDEQDDDFNQGDINGYDDYDYAFEDEWAELEATKEAKVVTPGCCYVASGASFFICIISVLVIVGVVLDDGDVTPREKVVDKDTLEYILPVVAGIPGMIGLALLLCGIVVWRRNKFLYSQLEKHRSTTYEMDDINNAESAGLVSNEDTNTNSTSFEQNDLNDLNDEDITLNNIEDEDVGIIEREDNVVSLSLDEDDEEEEQQQQEEQETEEERLAREAEQRIIEEEEARAIAMLMQTSNTTIPTKKEAPNTNYDNTSNNNDNNNNNAHVSSVNDNKQPELSEASELPITENDEDDDFDDDDEEDDEIELTFE